MHEFTHVFFLHMLMYKQKFTSLHFFVSPSLVAAGWSSFVLGSSAWYFSSGELLLKVVMIASSLG
jgi:hypothetical protein